MTSCNCALLAVVLAAQAFGATRQQWRIEAEIVDTRISLAGPQATNVFKVIGYYSDGRFQLDSDPVKTEDEIAESVGYDGTFLYLIQRYPDYPGKHLPRDKALAYVEPTIYSRYATDALAGMLMGFANDASLAQLQTRETQVILGVRRLYPEEDNKYHITRTSEYVEIEAMCPPFRADGLQLTPIEGIDQPFRRWVHKTSFNAVKNNTGVQSFTFEYDRYWPVKGKLYQERRVAGKVTLYPANEDLTTFKPLITENRLRILDYTGRAVLYPYNKGIADQSYLYETTNHSWDVDRARVAASFLERRAHFEKLGIPREVTVNNRNALPVARRVGVIAFLVAACAFFAVLIRNMARRRTVSSHQGKVT